MVDSEKENNKVIKPIWSSEIRRRKKNLKILNCKFIMIKMFYLVLDNQEIKAYLSVEVTHPTQATNAQVKNWLYVSFNLIYQL